MRLASTLLSLAILGLAPIAEAQLTELDPPPPPTEDIEDANAPQASNDQRSQRSYDRSSARRSQQRESDASSGCGSLPSHLALTRTIESVVTPGDKSTNGGLGNNMWAVVVDRSGEICTVTHSGDSYGDQWPGSRLIAAKKAFTANAYSLPNFALSTANIYFGTLPGGYLWGLQNSNPLQGDLYAGPASSWGTQGDPLDGKRVGGTTLFAGGLALYNRQGEIVGALGMSGDKSCTDHIIAWKTRHLLNLDNVPAGVNQHNNDNIIFDIVVDPASGRLTSASGYGHPKCGPTATQIARSFHETFPTGPEP